MGTTRANDELADTDDLNLLDCYWRAANYLSVDQIYLLDNPLLQDPLRSEHIKPRLLGHWGTTPGLNFIYAHLNHAIRALDLNVIYVCGLGHDGLGIVANTDLEGSTAGSIPISVGIAMGCVACSGNFRSPAAFQVTQLRKRRVRSTKATNSVMRWCTPMARLSTILT